QTNPLRNQTIAVRGFRDMDGQITGTPGNFVGSGEEALNARQAGGPGTYEPGFEVGVGWRFRDGSAVPASRVHPLQDPFLAAAPPLGPGFTPGAQLENTFLFSPVINFPVEYNGPGNDVINPANKAPATGSTIGIWNAADLMSIEFIQRATQYQVLYRVPVWES